jgi:hypothetical protein
VQTLWYIATWGIPSRFLQWTRKATGGTGMATDTQPNDSLVEFYEDRRRCFLNTKDGLRHVWSALKLVDQTWQRELQDLSNLPDPSRTLPVALFHNAVLRVRLAFELGFSRCLPEACDLLRGGIESVAYARVLLAKPHLVPVWAGKNLEERLRQEFRREFGRRKVSPADERARRPWGRVIFGKEYGTTQLERFWERYSEYGAHATMRGLATRLAGDRAGHIEFRCLDAPRNSVEAVLCDMLVCSRVMEGVLYSGFEQRLSLDYNLERMRQETRTEVSRVVSWLRTKYAAVLRQGRSASGD